jgi:hypothetical protein
MNVRDTSWMSFGCLCWMDASRRCRLRFGEESSACRIRLLVMDFSTLVEVLLDATSAFNTEKPVGSSRLQKRHEYLINESQDGSPIN